MPDLRFQVEDAEAVPFAAAPLLVFRLRVTNATAEPIHSILLRCQLQLEVTRRRYTSAEQERLGDLFGEPARWGQTLRSMLWTITSTVVPPFTDSVLADLQVSCTYDLNVVATKYFYALVDGEIPLTFMFSGTVFYGTDDGVMQVAQIPWDREASYRLPVSIWQQMIDLYYPNTAWLTLQRDVFDRLYRYKVSQGLPSWEQALERLLNSADFRF